MASELPPDPFEELSSSPSLPPGPQRKSWPDLRKAVKKTRKLATTLVHRIPQNFTFRHVMTESGQLTRLYFLGVVPGSRENTLLYVDVPEELKAEPDVLEWKTLLDSFHATPMFGQFSKEEQLLRERKRLGSFGITSYDFCDHQGKFVFPACSSLFLCVDSPVDGKFVNQPVFPTEVKSSSTGSRLDPKLCPHNPELLAYVCNCDIWLTHLQTGVDRRLTFIHKGSSSLSEDPVSAGVPSFVVQEEFDRYTGYWWQPVSTRSGELPTYRILYEEVDESEVEILHIMSSDEKGYDEYRYPRAGTPNAKSNLKILEFHIDENGAIISVVDKQLYEPLANLFPWAEYIPRAGWTSDGNYVYVQLLDRRQQKLQLVLLPLECFCLVCEEDVEMNSFDSSSLCPVQVIYEDTSEAWVNVHDLLYFFPQENDHEISFLWSTEKSGFRHLYHVTSSLVLPVIAGQESAMDMVEKHTDSMCPNVRKEQPLTSGDWETIGKQVWVDELRKLVYFVAVKDTPLEQHLYVTSYEDPGAVVRLTTLGFSHSVSLDQECSVFVSVYSNISQAPACQVHKLNITEEGKIETHPVATLLESSVISEDYHPPELFSYQSESGHTMYGMFYPPHELEEGCQYPTVMFVYGGPQVQLVTNAYKGIRLLRLHTLASMGYCVIVIDTRGSCHRGLNFESHVKDRLGSQEIADQVEGLFWLASQLDYIDLSRVAIHGWSYGGYLSLMGLAQRPDVFKVAVAGAPVTSWTLYDTGYTERYMDLPQNNQEGYKNGSVLEYVDKLPSESNRLLVVHGLIDENVHFFHTSALINAMIKACKPYQLQVYPNERHGIRNSDASEHYETMVLDFLQQNL